jgi:signal transduction histidine kinase
MSFWQKYTDLIIPKHLKVSSASYRKAVIFAWVHVFIFLSVCIFSYLDYILKPQTPIPVLICIPLALISMFIFIRFGNLVLSGNIVALFWFSFFGNFVLTTGGLHSDNILWLQIAPIIALLLANRVSGLIWLLIVNFFTSYIYILGKSQPDLHKILYDDTYYYASYVAISVLLLTIMWIFETGQIFVIRDLNDKNKLLEAQKHEIAKNVNELQAIEQKLLLSNQELQNFAYAASHDLKEPLRMINMYTQLIQKRITSQLDERTIEYMFFITDGVKRMQKLLDDLLQYSRLGRNSEDIKEIDLNNTLLMVIYNLTVRIKDTGAAITTTPLPVIIAPSTEMTQLFQNLIANALKFKKPEVEPDIQIAHIENQHEHLFSLSDNGIGIKKEHQEKVFNIFTRLHTRNEYEGSGIGLATCKKIIETLEGRMWLTSTEGVGTTFYFTIPKSSDSRVFKEKELNIIEN